MSALFNDEVGDDGDRGELSIVKCDSIGSP